ncbi:MAG: AI-2E family transporter [Armatimonadetes bacterium]|nr:AI-2E family transporter [Armatimonadota bacterium]
MDRERFRLTLFFILLTLLVGVCVVLVWPFLRLIALAVVLAVVVYPAHRRIARRIRGPSVAAALSCGLVVVAVVLPMALVTARVVDEATALTEEMKTAFERGELPAYLRPLDLAAVRDARRWVEERIALSGLDLESAVRETVTQASAYLAAQSMVMVRNLVWGAVQLLLALVTLFFLLRDAPRLLNSVRAFAPLDPVQTDAVLRRATDTIHATVYGAMIVAITQGTLGGLAFWALGLPSALLWGVVMTMLCFVPLLGAPVVWVPAAIALLLQGAYAKAVGLALWGALVVGLVDNLLRPTVIGARTQLHPLVVFFSVFGGLLLIGPLAFILGPVIAAVTLALLDILKLQLAEGRAAAPVEKV